MGFNPCEKGVASMALNPKLLAAIATTANSERTEEVERYTATKIEQAKAELPSLLPILEQFIRTSASDGCFRATVFQWTEGRADNAYGCYYSARYAEGGMLAHAAMTAACLPFFRKYHSVLSFDRVAEYIAAHFRNDGFRVDIVREYFGPSQAVCDGMWFGEGRSVIVSWWKADEAPSEPDPTPWWRLW